MTIKILQGNCINKLKTIADKTFHTCVTSPPYWGLRDYGVDNQLGLEETPQEYVANLVEVFREVRRVLRDDGTMWLNLGDSYSSGGRTTTTNQTVRGGKDYGVTRPAVCKDIKPKDLVGIPWRVAFALQEDGWYLRQDIIWHKPNPMPESVKDRCTKSHEYIFLFSKSKNYYFDNEVIKEKGTQKKSGNVKPQKGVDQRFSETKQGLFEAQQKIYEKVNKRSVWTMDSKYKDDEQEREHRQGMSKTRGDKLVVTRPKLPSQENFVKYIKSKTNVNVLTDYTGIKKSTIEHWFRLDKTGFSYPSRDDWMKVSTLINDNSDEFNKINEMMTHEEYHYDEIVTSDTRNKRSVWTVTTKPYKEAHFATYPPDLIEPCILAGCPEGGHVLDPFGGSGTTALVADRLGRNATLIELNKSYVDIINNRLKADNSLFMEIVNDN